MQPSVSVAQQLPTASSTMPLASTTAAVGCQLRGATAAFGDALGNLLVTVGGANQRAAPTEAVTAIAQATADPPASDPTLQSDETPSGSLVAYVLPSPSKAPPETQPVRRGTPSRASWASRPVDQRASPTDAQPLPAATPLPKSSLEHAAPAASRYYAEAPEQKGVIKGDPSPQTVEAPGAPTPLPKSSLEHAAPAASRHHAEAPEQKGVIKGDPSPQTVEAPGAPTSVSVEAVTSPPSQDGRAVVQSAALPAIELTPAAQLTPAAFVLPPTETAIRAPSSAGTPKAQSESHPVRRRTFTCATSVSVPVDQQALPTEVQPLPMATPLPDTLDYAAPTASRQRAETSERNDVAKGAPSPQTVEAPSAQAPVSVDPTSPPPPQDAQAAAPAQYAALPAVELTPQMPAASSAPSNLAAVTSPSHVASPAAQLAPALVQVGHAPDGAQRLTVRLDPPELGHVQVRIDRPTEAAARVEITVEKPETLTLLLRDQPQLQHALDLAGVPAEGRSVAFHVASPEPASLNSEPATAPAAGVAAGGLNGDGSHGASRQGGQSGRQQDPAQNGSETAFTPIGLTGWLRGGLDITA